VDAAADDFPSNGLPLDVESAGDLNHVDLANWISFGSKRSVGSDTEHVFVRSPRNILNAGHRDGTPLLSLWISDSAHRWKLIDVEEVVSEAGKV